MSDDPNYWGHLAIWMDVLRDDAGRSELFCRQRAMGGWSGSCNVNFEIVLEPDPHDTSRGRVVAYRVTSIVSEDPAYPTLREAGPCRQYASCLGHDVWLGRPAPVAPVDGALVLRSGRSLTVGGSAAVIDKKRAEQLRELLSARISPASTWREDLRSGFAEGSSADPRKINTLKRLAQLEAVTQTLEWLSEPEWAALVAAVGTDGER